MTTSAVQIQANKTNAIQSTGPISEKGKQVVANNAIKHGLFSKQLILNTENETDYQLLLEELQTEAVTLGIDSVEGKTAQELEAFIAEAE